MRTHGLNNDCTWVCECALYKMYSMALKKKIYEESETCFRVPDRGVRKRGASVGESEKKRRCIVATSCMKLQIFGIPMNRYASVAYAKGAFGWT